MYVVTTNTYIKILPYSKWNHKYLEGTLRYLYDLHKLFYTSDVNFPSLPITSSNVLTTGPV